MIDTETHGLVEKLEDGIKLNIVAESIIMNIEKQKCNTAERILKVGDKR